MTSYLVTRHEGTRQWVQAMAAEDRLPFRIDRVLEHLDPAQLHKGDVVVGTLPVHVAAALHGKGVTFWSLDLDVPPHERGKELNEQQIAGYGGRFTRYEVRAKQTGAVAARRDMAPAPSHPAITLIAVSEQLAPAAIGWLHDRTETVCLLASRTMKAKADLLERWFSGVPSPPKVFRLDWKDDDYATLLSQAEDLADTLAASRCERVVINLTGGTKPMAMALQRSFGKRAEAFGGQLFGPYIDTQHARIEDLLAHDVRQMPLRSVLNVADLLALQGIEVISAQSACNGYESWLGRDALFDLLLSPRASSWLPAWYEVLGICNDLVDRRRNKAGNRSNASRFVEVQWQDSDSEPTFVISVRDRTKNNWNGLCRALRDRFGKALHECGVVRWSFDEHEQLSLQFSRNPLDELAFAAGGWLEVWIARQFANADADDWAQGVQVSRDGVKNEFDLVAACGNRVLLIEVKTGNLTRDGKEDSKATEAVYKLDALAEKAGRYFSERWLVSLKKLADADRRRADKHGIRVFEAAQDVRAAIGEWVKRSKGERDPALRHSLWAAPAIGEPSKRS